MTNNDKLFEILESVDVNWFNAAINISLKGRYVYVENPKVASSTIKSKLHSNELIGLRDLLVGPHPNIIESPFIKPYQLPLDQLSEILFGGEFFKFAFVRNPYDRVLSAYLDKVVRNAPEKGQIDAYWKRRYGAPKEAYTFGEFLEGVAGIPDNGRDKHWRTQSSITLAGFINYNFIGRLERINTDLEKLQHMSRIDFRNMEEHSPHRTQAAEKRRQYFDGALAADVARIYRADFERFDYFTDLLVNQA